jgi:hypothetical protein
VPPAGTHPGSDHFFKWKIPQRQKGSLAQE